jgi:hypothetical protein
MLHANVESARSRSSSSMNGPGFRSEADRTTPDTENSP